MAVPFDTLKMVERLEQAGVPLEQAKAQAAIMVDAFEAEDKRIAERFATREGVEQQLVGIRSDINDLRNEQKLIRGEINQVKAELGKAISDSKAEMIRWVVSVGILQIALIAALVLKLVQ